MPTKKKTTTKSMSRRRPVFSFGDGDGDGEGPSNPAQPAPPSQSAPITAPSGNGGKKGLALVASVDKLSTVSNSTFFFLRLSENIPLDRVG